MYPNPMTNDPNRVAPDHRIQLPGPTPVRPRRPIAAGVLSVLLGLSCFAASPAWAYKAGTGANDRPWNANIKVYRDVAAYIADAANRNKYKHVQIGSLVYLVTALNNHGTAEAPLTDSNLPPPVDTDRLFKTVAVGGGANAESAGATAIGSPSSAVGPYAVAIGSGSSTAGRGAVALGWNSRARWHAIAVGEYSRAQSLDSTAVGMYSTAHGAEATSLGSRTEALGQGATALGSGSRATSYASTAIGYFSWAHGLHGAPSGSTAVGVKSHATGEKSAALGGYATAAGDYSTAVGQASEAHGQDTVAVGRGAVAGADLPSDKHETYRYSNVAKYLADTRPAGVKTVQIREKVYQVAALNAVTSLTEDNLPGALTTTRGGVAVGFRAAAEGMNSIALGWKAKATGTKGIAIGSDVTAGANEVVVGASGHTYKLPGLKTTSGTRVVTVDSNGRLSTQTTTTGTASSRGAALRGAAGLSSEVTAVSRTEAADYEKAPAIGSGPTAPATAEQRRVVVQDTNRDGSVRLRTLDFGDLSGMEQRLAGVDRRVTSLSERLNKATAMSSALSALPNVVPGDNRFFLGVGAGHYSSEQALAIGMSARVQSRVFVNAGVALASGDEVSVRGGVGVVW